MERFWTLKHLQQQDITELDAALVKEAAGGAWLVRAETLPLVFTVMGAQGLPRGARVRVKLGDVDLMALDVSGTVTARLDSEAPTETGNEEAEDEEIDNAGPLQIAVDLDEPAPPTGS
jgi:exoribonuclease-2